jgi:hypothetical protein
MCALWRRESSKCLEFKRSGAFEKKRRRKKIKSGRKPRNRRRKVATFGSIEAKPDTAVTSLTCQKIAFFFFSEARKYEDKAVII